MSGLIIIPLIDFKIFVDNPSNPQLFLVCRLVIIVVIVDSFTYLCLNEIFFDSKKCFVASVVNTI